MNSIWGVFALPSENLPVAVLDSSLCEVPDDLSHEDRLPYATLELGGATLSPGPCRWQVQICTPGYGEVCSFPCPSFRTALELRCWGPAHRQLVREGRFWTRETCGRSATAQHSASRSTLSIAQVGRRCSVRRALEGSMWGIHMGASSKDMHTRPTMTCSSTLHTLGCLCGCFSKH